MKIIPTLFCFFQTFIFFGQAVYNGSNKHIFTTNHGTIEIGPFNGSWGHIYTDRPNIIFNKDIYTTTNSFSSYNNDLILKTEGNERMRINDDTGHVGIGSNNPQSPLHIVSNYDAIQTFQTSDDTWLYTNWKGSNGVRRAYLGLNNTLGEFRIGVENGTNEIILDGGNVGIGTTNPVSKLQVNGDFYLYSNDAYPSGWGKTYFHWRRHSLIMGTPVGTYAHNKIELKPGGSNSGEIYSMLEFYQALGENNHERRVRITSNLGTPTFFNAGNVGIGTETPDAKLAVNGDIHAEEVKVDLNVPGPDYVFKEGYDLKSLEEVQKHINEHGHLPNIPSANEMKAHGIHLGEMNMKLLEKIEELTLYTLQQQKKIEEAEKVKMELELLKGSYSQLLKRIEQLENQ